MLLFSDDALALEEIKVNATNGDIIQQDQKAHLASVIAMKRKSSKDQRLITAAQKNTNTVLSQQIQNGTNICDKYVADPTVEVPLVEPVQQSSGKVPQQTPQATATATSHTPGLSMEHLVMKLSSELKPHGKAAIFNKNLSVITVT